ncbi:hypothetical protein BO221_43795 [Archangium sp. Cb G35]|nr:hypothetical protein BO221_43795 [Archangium sp. Cb G35]
MGWSGRAGQDGWGWEAYDGRDGRGRRVGWSRAERDGVGDGQDGVGDGQDGVGDGQDGVGDGRGRRVGWGGVDGVGKSLTGRVLLGSGTEVLRGQ